MIYIIDKSLKKLPYISIAKAGSFTATLGKSYYLVMVFCLVIVSSSLLLYQLIVIDATIRGLKHPKLWGLLASNGNNSSGLLLYLIGRRNYPINSINSNQKTKMIQRKKAAGISLCFMVVGILGLILSISL